MEEMNKKEDEEVKHTVHQMVMRTMEKRRAGGETGSVRAGVWGVGAGEGGGIPESPLLAGQEAYQSHFVAILSLPWCVHQA